MARLGVMVVMWELEVEMRETEEIVGTRLSSVGEVGLVSMVEIGVVKFAFDCALLFGSNAETGCSGGGSSGSGNCRRKSKRTWPRTKRGIL